MCAGPRGTLYEVVKMLWPPGCGWGELDGRVEPWPAFHVPQRAPSRGAFSGRGHVDRASRCHQWACDVLRPSPHDGRIEAQSCCYSRGGCTLVAAIAMRSSDTPWDFARGERRTRRLYPLSPR